MSFFTIRDDLGSAFAPPTVAHSPHLPHPPALHVALSHPGTTPKAARSNGEVRAGGFERF
jgi:hypothetical protein